jgi:hypothetical protein
MGHLLIIDKTSNFGLFEIVGELKGWLSVEGRMCPKKNEKNKITRVSAVY